MAFARMTDGQNLFASDINEMQASIEATVLKRGHANLTGSGSPALYGFVDGVNTVFGTPLAPYSAGSLLVYLNGVFQVPGDAYIESDPVLGEFTFQVAPSEGDQIFVLYQQFTVDGITASSNQALNIALAVVL